MSENQESDNNNNNNINNELVVLEDKIKIAKEEKELAEYEYNEVHNKIQNLNSMLSDYNTKKETIPHQYDFMISIIVMITIISAIALTSLLLGNLTLISIKSAFWLGGIISLLSMPIMSFIEIKLFKKLQKVFENTSCKHIMNSEEYQKVLIQIESIEEDLEKSLDDELTKKINMRNATANYSAALSELTMKHSMINYYPKNENSTRVTTRTTKAYSRVRKNNHKRNTRGCNEIK